MISEYIISMLDDLIVNILKVPSVQLAIYCLQTEDQVEIKITPWDHETEEIFNLIIDCEWSIRNNTNQSIYIREID